MNKTVTVNIGGIVFHIDENAFERFKNYLESIRKHFTASEGRDEIMQDIESRIAEMFQERKKDSKEVITMADVEAVTGIMGRPEQFGNEEEKETSHTTAGIPVQAETKKRLFRNPDDKLIGGVCSGIASYFDIDAVWVRLVVAFISFPIFFNSFFGTAFLIYIILWFIIPEAKTTAEKLTMKGQPVNISNIEKNVHEEKITKSRNDSFIHRFFNFIGQIVKGVFKLIGKLIAIFFLFIGGLGAVAIFASLFALFKIPGTHYPIILDHIFEGGAVFSLGLIGLVLLIGIPFLIVAYLGARMLFKTKKLPRVFSISLLLIWITGLFICLFVGVKTAKEFSKGEKIRKEMVLSPNTGKTLFVKFRNEDIVDEKYTDWDDHNDWEDDLRINITGDQLQSKNILLDVIRSKTDSFKLEEIFLSRGSSKKEAADNASHIIYSATMNDSVLDLEPFFTLSKNEKYRAQKVQLVLHIPENGKVFLDKSTRRFIYDIENSQNILDHDMVDRTWQMTSEGLSCVDCTGNESVIGGTTKMGKKMRIHHGNGAEVRIDENGLLISDEDENIIRIDSTGIMINDGKGKKSLNKSSTVPQATKKKKKSGDSD